MPDREKLIELLWEYDQMRMMRMSVEECADRLVPKGLTVQQWISVKDRLPEKEGRYLCVVPFSESGAVYMKILNGDTYGFILGDYYNNDITHWMPLPEPPKGE